MSVNRTLPQGAAPPMMPREPISGPTAAHPIDRQEPHHELNSTETNPINDAANEGGKLPFKEQVKAYAKVHRGTLLADHEQKELGQKILAGEVAPSTTRDEFHSAYHSDMDRPVAHPEGAHNIPGEREERLAHGDVKASSGTIKNAT